MNNLSSHWLLVLKIHPLAAMPSPPPPYSPTPSQSMSQAIGGSPSIATTSYVSTQSASPSTARSEYPPSATSSAASLHRPTASYDYGRQANISPASSVASPVATMSFPPPPPSNTRDRSASRTRGERSIFGLSALTSRNRNSHQSEAPSAIETLRQNTSDALARAPGPSIHAPIASRT